MAMQSKINPATIDVTYPIAGQDNDTQGFRTNFSTIYDCLITAKTEITSLQNGIVATPVITTIPITTTANGTPGELAYSNDFLYVCIAPNNWVKFPSTASVGGAGSYVDATGTSDVLYADFSPTIEPLVDGMILGVGAVYSNQTSTPTINVVTVDGPSGPKSIYKGTNKPLLLGDIGGGNHEMQLIYNGGTDSFTLLNPIFSVATVGVEYSDTDDYQYFSANLVSGSFITDTSGNLQLPNGEYVYQGASWALATARGMIAEILPGNVVVLEASTFTANGATNYFGIWNFGQTITGANTGSVANLYSYNNNTTTSSSDVLTVEFKTPYNALLDGLTIGSGAMYVNQTTTPTLNIDGLGAYPITKGTNKPLVLGDIGGPDHEMLLTFNMGRGTWVLQNPMFGITNLGPQYVDATGTSEALSAQFSIPINDLVDGMVIGVGAQYPNTTSTPTLALNKLPAARIYKNNNQPLSPGDIAGANHEMQLVYNAGTASFTLLNPSPMGTFAAGNITVAGTLTTSGYAIASLPTPVIGMRTYVTTGPTIAPTVYSLVGASNIAAGVYPVFYNGTAWIYN